MSDTLQHGRHQFGKKIFIENIVNHSWAIRLGLGLARHGAIPGNSGCPEGVPGVFRACSGFFPGILTFIFKYPFSWCKVISKIKCHLMIVILYRWLGLPRIFGVCFRLTPRKNSRIRTSHQLAASWITLPMKIFWSWFLFNRLHFKTRAESFKAGLRLVRQIWIQILELLRFLLKSKFS